jgi:hypothetical protein
MVSAAMKYDIDESIFVCFFFSTPDVTKSFTFLTVKMATTAVYALKVNGATSQIELISNGNSFPIVTLVNESKIEFMRNCFLEWYHVFAAVLLWEINMVEVAIDGVVKLKAVPLDDNFVSRSDY